MTIAELIASSYPILPRPISTYAIIGVQRKKAWEARQKELDKRTK